MTALIGREDECAALDELLAGARAGAGGVLVLRGEPGIGRTSLLEYAIGSASGMRIARLHGVDSEIGLGYAGLQRMLAPIGHAPDGLPGPQRDALRAAFGLVTGAQPDRFLVGLAALGLLRGSAAGRPLLVAVDDAHWLDQATVEVLAFVARRVAAEPIAFVVTVRDPTHRCHPLDGLPTRHLAGLAEPAARDLLEAVATGPLDPRATRRVVAETGGNPLALVEFGRLLLDGQWPVGLPSPQPLPIGARLQEQFLRWVRPLPAGTQTLLLLVAAEPTGSPAILRAACDRLGLSSGGARPAEEAGLLAYGDRVVLTNPLVRSAIYHGAPPRELRRVHAALAAVLDPVADADARAWHLAAAARGTDEHVARELVAAAGRARAGTDHATEALLLARAAELTPDPGRRAGRLLDAAGAELDAGEPSRAEALLDRAGAATLAPPARVRAAGLRASVSLVRDRYAEAPAALLRAALDLRPADPGPARRLLADALYAGLAAGTGTETGTETVLKIVHCARTWPAASAPTTADLLLDAFATRLADGHRAAVPALRAAVGALTARSADDSPYLLALGCWAAADLLDGDALRLLTDRRKRDSLLPGLLPLACGGPEAEARAAIADGIRSSIASGAGLGVAVANYAATVLELGLGRYDAALTAALAVHRDDPPGLGTYVLPDLVEAAVRSGNQGAARSAAERLAGRAVDDTALAAGLLARSRALLAGTGGAEELYQQAVERLRHPGEEPHLARAHLLYGEWLRRRRRRRDARLQLHTAIELFDALGFEAFGQRSRGELLATGERTGRRDGRDSGQLTPQEMQVARLVVGGASNRQVAEQLFISPNTVEYHLQKVFRKVGVSSRTQLARALLAEPLLAEPLLAEPLLAEALPAEAPSTR